MIAARSYVREHNYQIVVEANDLKFLNGNYNLCDAQVKEGE